MIKKMTKLVCIWRRGQKANEDLSAGYRTERSE